jgi:hypothetical protein
VTHAYILATWEAEIGRIVVHSQPGQIIGETPPQLQNNQSKIDWTYCFASIKPQVQTPVSPKIKIKKKQVLSEYPFNSTIW